MNPIQLAVDALSQGSQYALIALGIGLVFGVMRMINFAHGDLIMIGAYALVVPSASDVAKPFIAAWPWPLLIVGIIVIVALAALATERFAFRPLRRRDVDSATLLISSFAISYLLQSLVLFFYTGKPKSVSIFSKPNPADHCQRRPGRHGRRHHHLGDGGIAGRDCRVPSSREGRHRGTCRG
jgi:branched-chain amino acid transport system permease protein